MGWKEPNLPAIEAQCDKCGSIDFIDAWNTPSGHWMYPQPGERGACGWDYGDGGEVLCPDCLGNGEPSAYDNGVVSLTVPYNDTEDY